MFSLRVGVNDIRDLSQPTGHKPHQPPFPRTVAIRKETTTAALRQSQGRTH